MAREVQVTIDCGDPASLAAFWAEALGYVVAPPRPRGSTPGARRWTPGACRRGRRNDRSAAVDPDGAGPRVFLQKVPEGKTAKNRLHLDVRAAPGLVGEERMAALEAEAERLGALGAVRVQRHEPGGLDAGHLVMRDPEGNEFCLD